MRNFRFGVGLSYLALSTRTIKTTLGVYEMAILAAWCTALFFLWYGLSAFVPALATDMFKKIGAVLALIVGAVGLLALLGMG